MRYRWGREEVAGDEWRGEKRSGENGDLTRGSCSVARADTVGQRGMEGVARQKATGKRVARKRQT